MLLAELSERRYTKTTKIGAMIYDPPLPSPFYRVTSRAIILDDQNRLIVVKDDKGHWQMPGGGWEHGESLLQCVQRELKEELGAEVVACFENVFFYMQPNRRGYYSFRVAVHCQVASHDFNPGDDMVEYRAVSREEFMTIKFTDGEGAIQDYADKIWPASATAPKAG